MIEFIKNDKRSNTKENRFSNIKEFISWFDGRRQTGHFSVSQIPFALMKQWYSEVKTQNLVHASGKFFKVEGIRVSTNFGSVKEWDQPIINQPEIGILGIITRIFDGERYFLMQAKKEPGNVNVVQLSPSVQATKSNYTGVHKGKLPMYLEYFLGDTKARILVDQLLTEQGGRFLRKRNRNMIIEVNEDIPPHEGFCWLALKEIKELIKVDNLVNMDARSVLSCTPLIQETVSELAKDDLGTLFEKNKVNSSMSEIAKWFNKQKTAYRLRIDQVALRDVNLWIRTDSEISHESKQFFSVIAVSVEAEGREIFHWSQPMFKDESLGLIGFITKKINGILHLLVQAKVEPGNRNIIEMAPTVSCSNVAFRSKQSDQPDFLDIFMNASSGKIIYSAIQSEEGGRFYHFQNKNMVIEVDESTSFEIPPNYTWMTLGQIMEFLKLGYLNIETRSLISCISPI